VTAATESAPAPGEVHVWRADLDRDDWPVVEGLPAGERRRAAAIVPVERRRRWVASRWALRAALALYLDVEPEAIELESDRRGKPCLAAGSPLRFNLSHSRELTLIAVATGREVGVDVQRRCRRPAAFYEDWVRREAIGKCFGVGLGAPPPTRPSWVGSLDVGPGWTAALAVAGAAEPPVRRFDLTPSATAAPGRR
jgi:hypothetical protein